MEPITRSEMLMDGQYVEPKTRKEKILAGEDLEPVTREEYFLKKYRHSGGDVDVVQLTATENKVYTAPEGKAYNPVNVNVPEKKLIGLYADENKTYRPSTGYDGFSEVTVDVPTPPPVLQSLTANHDGYFVPSSGYQGFSEVTVSVPPILEDLSVTENGTYTPSSGYQGFNEVSVNVPLPNNAYLLESQKDDVVTIQHGAEFDMPKLIASIEPQQSGSGDPSPTNIRPISGWSEANVQVNDGQNLYGGTFNTLFPLFVPKNTRITVSSKTQTSFAVFDKDKNQIDYWGLYDVDTTTGRYYRTFNFQYDIYYVKFVYTSAEELQIKYGTDITYSPYNGTTYTINFVDGSSPLTVYGGTLNVLSGLLTITDGYISSYNGETLPSTWISDRDVYAEGTTPTTGAEVCYKLATPQTYQLTPTEVKSLLGVNNIFADTGEVDVQIWTKEV